MLQSVAYENIVYYNNVVRMSSTFYWLSRTLLRFFKTVGWTQFALLINNDAGSG